MRSRLLPKLVFLALALVPVALLAVPAGSLEDIAERLRSPAQLCMAGESCVTAGAIQGAAGQSPDEIYQSFCFACHATGVSQAPILGDVNAWKPHLAKGVDTLYGSVINGIGLMPPKGTCMSCSDDDLRAVVDYMVEQSR